MRILWVKTDFLHPTTRGGQIRTLGMLKALHRRHEIHYVCFDDGTNPEGARRSSEYCSQSFPIPHSIPPRRSLRFAGQLIEGLLSPVPVSVARYVSRGMKQRIEGFLLGPTDWWSASANTCGGMKQQIQELLGRQKYDSLVCDFLFPAPNIPDISRAVLFQHNVESIIWRRHAKEARNPAKKAYFRLQARRMEAFEGDACRRAGCIVAVSEVDRATMRELFGAERISTVATGVDIDYFAPPGPKGAPPEPKTDLIFVGSMDWLPNIDAIQYFAAEIFPLIHKQRPECRLVVAGRRPSPALEELSRKEPRIVLTGTVPDVRPYLWDSRVSIVPLRIGGGTRLKIFEAIAAKLPVVSTSVGAEGLPLQDGVHIAIADTPELFAQRCLELLAQPERRREIIEQSLELVAGRFSWDAVTREFECALDAGPRPN